MEYSIRVAFYAAMEEEIKQYWWRKCAVCWGRRGDSLHIGMGMYSSGSVFQANPGHDYETFLMWVCACGLYLCLPKWHLKMGKGVMFELHIPDQFKSEKSNARTDVNLNVLDFPK